MFYVCIRMYTELHDPSHATENCQIKSLGVLVLLDIDKSGLLQMLSLTGILLSYVNIIKQIWSGQKERKRKCNITVLLSCFRRPPCQGNQHIINQSPWLPMTLLEPSWFVSIVQYWRWQPLISAIKTFLHEQYVLPSLVRPHLSGREADI